jgi:hypothetical protein
MNGMQAIQALRDGHRVRSKSWTWSARGIWLHAHEGYPEGKNTISCRGVGALTIEEEAFQLLDTFDSRMTFAGLVLDFVWRDDWEIVDEVE